MLNITPTLHAIAHTYFASSKEYDQARLLFRQAKRRHTQARKAFEQAIQARFPSPSQAREDTYLDWLAQKMPSEKHWPPYLRAIVDQAHRRQAHSTSTSRRTLV